MNGHELADRLEDSTENFTCIYNISAAAKLRQLQTERDLLFQAHSVEMVRADTLATEVEDYKTECARLYRIIELNESLK
jgi:hypothetical protein